MAHHIAEQGILWRGLNLDGEPSQVIWPFTPFVHFDDVQHIIHFDGHRRGAQLIKILKPHLAPEDVCLEMPRLSLSGEKLGAGGRKFRHRLFVLIEFEIEAAL